MFWKRNHQPLVRIYAMISFLSWSFVFAIIYSQSPLFTSNQNQYFLHGLADAGYGSLNEDWLANTIDPTPVFSALVNWTYRIFDSATIYYGIYALVLGVYLRSVMGIIDELFKIGHSRTKTLTYMVLFLGLHSAAIRYLLSGAVGPDWTFLFEGGIAGQRLLGTVLQPSAFGVLLVMSVYLYLKGNIYPALLAMAGAVYIHPTYLLSGAILSFGYIWVEYREKGTVRTPIFLAVTSLALVSPVLIYVYQSFGTAPQATVARAQEILVDIRIPHHAIIRQWFNASVLIQIGIVAAALWFIRKTKLFEIMLVSTLFAIVLTVLQVIIDSDALALLFPWRISVLLVPLSTAILLEMVVSFAWNRLEPLTRGLQKAIVIASVLGIMILMLIGATRFRLDIERKANNIDIAMMGFVNKTKRSGEVFLVPEKMQDFRLETGAPIYVDFKSIPYAPEEVLEWRRRDLKAGRFYREGEEACEALGDFADEGVTHVVLETGDPINTCEYLKVIYQDPNYSLFQVILE